MRTNRLSLARVLVAARGETRLALAAAPRVAWRIFTVVAWAAVAILSGLLVGFAAVILPPMGLAGIIGVFVLVLLWVLPDGFDPPDRLIRTLLMLVLFADICLPTYYSIQIPGLPWVSARRIVTFILIVIFSVSFSTSKVSRKRVFGVMGDNILIFSCVFGFLAMATASLFTSIMPLGSLSSWIDAVLEWYVPFICAIYALRDEKDVEMLMRVMCWFAIGLALIGGAEYFLKKSVYIMLMPEFMFRNMTENSEFARTTLTAGFNVRMGQVRVNGPYVVSLSYAEFQAMVAPFGATFLLHGRTFWEKVFGALVLIACLGAIYVSGSRGGYLSFLLGNFMLVGLFVARSRLMHPRSLIAPLFAVLGSGSLVAVLAAIAFIGRVRNLIFASGEGALSTEGRVTQWAMGWPKVMANPVTGHGFSAGGEIVGYRPVPDAPLTVDSYLLSLLVETGVPSVIFYFGMSIVSVWTGVREYFTEAGRIGVLSGGLACSISGFTAYRFFLSQRENQTLFFILVGCVALLHHFSLRARGAGAPART